VPPVTLHYNPQFRFPVVMTNIPAIGAKKGPDAEAPAAKD
jgi:hypothetical protein